MCESSWDLAIVIFLRVGALKNSEVIRVCWSLNVKIIAEISCFRNNRNIPDTNWTAISWNEGEDSSQTSSTIRFHTGLNGQVITSTLKILLAILLLSNTFNMSPWLRRLTNHSLCYWQSNNLLRPSVYCAREIQKQSFSKTLFKPEELQNVGKKRWNLNNHVIFLHDFSSNTNPKWTANVAFSSSLVWTGP